MPIDLETTVTDPPTTSLSYYQCDKVGNTKIPINNRFVEWISGQRLSVRALADIQYADTLMQMRRFYFSAIKWVDEQLGRALDALDTKRMTNNTIILFAGDHGWLIGEKKSFCKNSLFDIGVRVPLYVQAPGALENRVVDQPTSLIDIFPTLIDLTGSKAFNDGTGIPLDGVSFAETLKQASREDQYAAYSQYPRCGALGEVQTRDCVRAQSYAGDGSCSQGSNRGRRPIRYMGYSIRTKQYRYVEWRPFIEVRSSCSKLTWEGLDSSNRDLETRRWQIDPDLTRTLWEQDPVEIELYDYSNEEYFTTFTEGPNLAGNFTELVKDFSLMIQRKFNSDEDPCNNRGHLSVSSDGTERCECLEAWTGLKCERLRENSIEVREIVIITSSVVGVFGLSIFVYIRYFRDFTQVRVEPIAEGRRKLIGLLN